MPKTLILVESPAKAKTINQYLGKNYSVMATYGHVRDLPQRKFGIDVNTFEVSYTIPKKAKEVIKQIKLELKTADKVLLATDGDREGEAIAWHMGQILKLPDGEPNRLKFFEVTKTAIEEAVAHPKPIDIKLVDAQQARRVVDRMVGYRLSPILWAKVRKGLSAGRVQSVALKLIVDREQEIKAFNVEDYFVIQGVFTTKEQEDLKGQLVKLDGEKLQKMSIKTQDMADKIVNALSGQEAKISAVERKQTHRSPGPPLITSSLQQEASNNFGYSPKKTMIIAQQLYEGVEMDGETHGLITYMRTDSHHLAETAVAEIRQYISSKFGEELVHHDVRRYTKKVKMSQEAHEAIRPTSVARAPESIKQHLSKDQFKVYELIWKRAVATQMADSLIEHTKVTVGIGNAEFEVKGERIIKPGYLSLYQAKGDKKLIKSALNEHDALAVKSIAAEQKSTEPPARYSAATLIKALEELGVGRPSTYAPTISTLTDRGYVEIEEKKLKPTEIAPIVTKLLADNFPFVVDAKFTAEMEKELDMIANGEVEWQPVVKEFYEPFEKEVEAKSESIAKIELPVEKTDERCQLCDAPMVVKFGRFGKFLACSRFPECKGTKAMHKHIGVECPKDGGKLVERKTRRGRFFFGCENWPKCDFASWKKPTKLKCPSCGSMMVEKNKDELECSKCKTVVKRN